MTEPSAPDWANHYALNDHLRADPAWRAYLSGRPCPPWCEAGATEAGHPFTFDPLRAEPGEPLYERWHRRALRGAADLALEIEQGQVAHHPHDPAASTTAPALWLHGRGADVGTELTATDARQLAAALHDAADALDELAVDELAVDELAVDELGVDELGVDELGVDELGVDELGVDELAVDELGVDELAVDELAVDDKLGRPLPPAWRQPVAQWLAMLAAAQRAHNTLVTYRQQLYNLASRCPNPWEVTEADLVAWLSSPAAPRTHRQRQKVAARFYAWALRRGFTTTDPTAHMAVIRTPRALPRPIPTDDLRQAFAAADGRARLALALAMYAGLRLSEIASLHVRDIGADTLHITGKGLKDRRVPLHPELSAMLATELDRRRRGELAPGWHEPPPPDGWIFPSRQRPGEHLCSVYLGRVMTAALPDGYTPHTLRHWFASKAYAAQRDLRSVQELLGHSSPTTTAMYAAVPHGALSSAVAGVDL